MLTQKLVEHFGNKIETARALGLTKQAISNGDDVVPEGTAYKAQILTGGRVKVDPLLYVNRGRSKKRGGRR